MNKIIFIQANDTKKIYRIVREKLYKKSSNEIGVFLGIQERQGSYYKSACVFFGLLKKSGLSSEYELTSAGRNIFDEKNYETSKKIFWYELLKSEIVVRIFDKYESFEELKLAYEQRKSALISILNDFGYKRMNSEITKKRRIDGCFFPLMSQLYEEEFSIKFIKGQTEENKLQNNLEEVEPPANNSATKKIDVSRSIKLNYLDRHKINIEVGKKGEKLVYEYEKTKLRNEGYDKLADKVEHVSLTQGDGLGYDILSFNSDGSKKYIEVKSTVNSSKFSNFFVSKNELSKSNELDEYYIYRVYDLNRTPKFFCKKGPISQSFSLECNDYIASLY